jgi:hypothetical protein
VKALLGACLAALLSAAAAAEPTTARDPMRPPPVAQRAAVGQPVESAAVPVAPVARHLLIVNGERFVIEGSRRRAVGDKLGEARIERIEDTAVVVSNNGVRQRIPLFAGVVKRPLADGAVASSPAASAPARAQRVAARNSMNVSPR